MKKIFVAFATTALIASVASCGKSAQTMNAEDAALSDSLTEAWGKVVGLQAKQMEQQASAAGDKFDEASFIRGLNTALSADTSDLSYLQGLQMGVRLAQNRNYVRENMDLDLNVNKFMNAIKAGMALPDSLANMQQAGAEFQRLAQQAEQAAQDRRNAEIEASEPSQNNIKAGQAYLDSVCKANKEVKIAPSGLGYLIENPGTGDSITDATLVKLAYVGKLTDGKVFDKNDNATFSPRGVIPGFSEGLKMLRDGGKAIFYIPGKLAYGVQGQPGAGIGPNQMLIFEVTVKGVEANR